MHLMPYPTLVRKVGGLQNEQSPLDEDDEVS
jgi:hypothetical protein